jgi:threonylcarbamoyladenosine tRNA methylthiotransferase MtaB
MKTFSINTLGCKVNQYETQQIHELLEQLGLRKIKPPKKADLVVINTCPAVSLTPPQPRAGNTFAKRKNNIQMPL